MTKYKTLSDKELLTKVFGMLQAPSTSKRNAHVFDGNIADLVEGSLELKDLSLTTSQTDSLDVLHVMWQKLQRRACTLNLLEF